MSILITAIDQLLDSFEWEHVIDEFEMKPDDAIVADALSANDRNDAEVVPFALHAKESSRLHIERSEDRRSAETNVLGHADLARRDIAVLVEHLEQKRLRDRESGVTAKITGKIALVRTRLGLDQLP